MEVFRTFCEYCGQDKRILCSCASEVQSYKMSLSEFVKKFEKEKDVVDEAIEAANSYTQEISQHELNTYLEDIEHDDECEVAIKEREQQLGLRSRPEPECECEFPYFFFIFSKATAEILDCQGPMHADYFRGCPPEEIAIPVMVWIGMTINDLRECLHNELELFSELFTDW